MGHGKLKKFSENETFSCLLQPASEDILENKESGVWTPLNLRDHAVKGHWSEQMFHGRNCPIVLELGCGKGEYTTALAERNPEMNYIGVDIKGARLWKGAKYATETGLQNVAFLRTRIEFIEAFFAPGEISEIWLTFSDPQMKSENSRLTSPMFLERYRHFLKPGGIVHLKTDSTFLYEYTKQLCAANNLHVLAYTSDLYGVEKASECRDGQVDSPESNPRESLYSSEFSSVCGKAAVDALFEVQTFYEQNFLSQGFKINYIAFTIDHEGPFVSPDFDAAYWREAEAPRFLPGSMQASTKH